MKRPGARLRSIAARLYSAATMARLIDPALADLQAEYEDARLAGRRWQSRWVWASGHAAFFRMIAVHGGHSALDLVRGMPGEERRTMIRLSALCLTIVILVAMVLTARGPRGSLVLGLMATAASAGYFVILIIARGSALPGPAAAWVRTRRS